MMLRGHVDSCLHGELVAAGRAKRIGPMMRLAVVIMRPIARRLAMLEKHGVIADSK